MTFQGFEASAAFRPAIVAPSYNNVRTVLDILRRLEAATSMPMFVVDDGSTDGTAEILSEWLASAGAIERHVLTHAQHRGKASALRTGFAAVIERGFTHVVTIDTDGQLQPEDVPRLLRAANDAPQSLLIGERDEVAPDYPSRSRVSNLLIRLECGVRIADSQCGLRVYPMALVQAVRCRANHYCFESEIIVRANWAGFDIAGVPVACRNYPSDQSTSHFRSWRDSFRALFMHANLVGCAICPWPLRSSVRASPQRERFGFRSIWKWVNPARAWRELRAEQISRTEFSCGFALGVFIANLPLYGFQTLLSLYCAARLHLNPISVVAGSQVATPPIGPLLIVAAITVGHVLFHGTIPDAAHFDIVHRGLSSVGAILVEWLIGGIVVGLAMAALAFAGASLALRSVFATDRNDAGASAAAIPGDMQ